MRVVAVADMVEAVLEVIDAEIKSGKHLIKPGFMRRYDKGYRQVKAAIQSGEYGEPLMVHCMHRNSDVPDSYTTRMTVDYTAIHEPFRLANHVAPH